MKIAIVNSEHPSPTGNDHGGIATYTYTLARFLAQRGHTVHILTRSSISPAHFPASIQFHRYGYVKSFNPIIRIFNRINRNQASWEMGHSRSINRKIGEIAQRDGLDIIDFPEYGGLACRYSYGKRIPCAITFHTPSEMVDTLNDVHPLPPRQQLYRLEEQGIARAAGYKSPSAALKQHVCSTYHLPGSSVAVVRNPLDFSAMQSWNEPDRAQQRFDILFSGRLERRKGADIILKSIQEILSISSNITFTFAGETEIGNALNYRQAIEQILPSGDRERVWFLGPLSSVKLQPLYTNSSLLLFPSLFENCPYTLLEALAAGLPVIASEGSGIGEIVTHDTDGLLFSGNDREQLIAHVKSLFSDREHARRLGENGARTVRRIFDPDTVTNSTIDFYQSVIRGNGS